MDQWFTITTFIYPHEAHLAKNFLEAEGIEVFLKDEWTVQINNLYSNAIGGVKLQVRKIQYDRAWKLLVESGYIQIQPFQSNTYMDRIAKHTARLPLVGRLPPSLRFIIICGILLTIIVVFIVIFILKID